MLAKYVGVILALAACSGGNSSPVNEGCPLIMLAPPAVLYPSSSTPLASTGGFNIIVAYQYGQYPLTLQATGVATVTTGPAVVGAGQSTAAYVVPAGSLQTGVTYAIVAELTFPGDCPTQRPTLGTFSTAP